MNWNNRESKHWKKPTQAANQQYCLIVKIDEFSRAIAIKLPQTSNITQNISKQHTYTSRLREISNMCVSLICFMDESASIYWSKIFEICYFLSVKCYSRTQWSKQNTITIQIDIHPFSFSDTIETKSNAELKKPTLLFYIPVQDSQLAIITATTTTTTEATVFYNSVYWLFILFLFFLFSLVLYVFVVAT